MRGKPIAVRVEGVKSSKMDGLIHLEEELAKLGIEMTNGDIDTNGMEVNGYTEIDIEEDAVRAAIETKFPGLIVKVKISSRITR